MLNVARREEAVDLWKFLRFTIMTTHLVDCRFNMGQCL